jgi:3-isopropylmalate/(R)-2-methylmalate dehydratase large subunit
MGMTIVEKIFAPASGAAPVRPGDLAVDVDIAVMMDTNFHANSRHEILKVHDPDKVAVIYVPASDEAAAEAHTRSRCSVRAAAEQEC